MVYPFTAFLRRLAARSADFVEDDVVRPRIRPLAGALRASRGGLTARRALQLLKECGRLLKAFANAGHRNESND
jgi:hypothetical protein